MAPPKKPGSLRRLRWFVFALIPLMWCFLADSGQLRSIENKFLDLRFRARGEIAAPVKLHYVDVDTRAVKYLGERPWDRSEFGAAAQALLELGHAKAVGFDFVFSDLANSKMVSRAELQKRNFEFGKVIHAHPEIVLAAQYTTGEGLLQEGQRQFPLLRLGYTDPLKNDVPELPQYPLFGPTWGTIGLIDVDYGYGGDLTPRWVPIFARHKNGVFYHMGLQLALRELGLTPKNVRIGARTLEIVDAAGGVVRSLPLAEGQLLEVNWFSSLENEKLNRHFSLADVLLNLADMKSDKPEARKEAEEFFAYFRDAIVLIGPTDPLLHDMGPAPFDSEPAPKVGLHANVAKTILSGRCLEHTPRWLTWVLTLGLTFIASVLAIAGGARGVLAKIFAVVALAGYTGVAFYLFAQSDLVLPLAAPLGAALSTSFATTIAQLITEEKQKGRIKGMFGTYISPQLVERMVESGEDPKLGGAEEQITAYFSDIQGFSGFSEKLQPPQLVELMNEYLTACTDIVTAQGGTLDKYIGDAVVAMFGAPIALPDHAYRACVATQLVHQKLGELRAKWKSEGDKWPEIVWKMQSRIGLNSGAATIGNMGSRTRFNYTMMGDNVNLAARMESGAKSWGAYTMVTEATKLDCEKHGGDRVVFRALGRIVVMGRSQPVPIHEIVGLKETVAPAALECIALFDQALARYYARDWAGAIELFKRSAELEPNQPGKTPGVKTNPSLVYIEKVVPEAMEEPPGADWDGRYVMKEK